jgi:hypothetical protein
LSVGGPRRRKNHRDSWGVMRWIREPSRLMTMICRSSGLERRLTSRSNAMRDPSGAQVGLKSWVPPNWHRRRTNARITARSGTYAAEDQCRRDGRPCHLIAG